MPELPEVETTCRGLAPLLKNQIIQCVDVHNARLRYPVPQDLNALCQNRQILSVYRRAKYIILTLDKGNLLIHLGMTGHLRLLTSLTQRQKHDHIEMTLHNGHYLRYTDPRRFGFWLWTDNAPQAHPVFAHLGPEPLSLDFDDNYLQKACFNKKQPIKSTLMDNRQVVGVGNIYATESLFLCGIHPLTPAGALSAQQYCKLTKTIKDVLQQAISAGGTTLRDFINPEGKPGYFSQSLYVYGRKNELCRQCQHPLSSLTIAGRSTAYCPSCQPLTNPSP